MRSPRRTPSFRDLKPTSRAASAAARGSSKKTATKCEIALRRALHSRGLRYRTAVTALPGTPDIVFASARVVVFVDGDFWHGRDLDKRLAKLAAGANAPYWVAKIRTNVERDRRHDAALRAHGWIVRRYWEGEIHERVSEIADEIEKLVRHARSATRSPPLRGESDPVIPS